MTERRAAFRRGVAKAATIREVAALAGVSTATVSRALAAGLGDTVAATAAPFSRRIPPVSVAKAERIAAAVTQLGYKTNHVARSLKTRSTKTIAILAPELANEFFMELAEGLERELKLSGYTLLIASSANSSAEEERRLGTLADRLVDGVVAIPAGKRGDHLTAAANRGLPVVLVDRLAEDAPLSAVLSENEDGAYRATRALIDDGARRIAFIGGDEAVSTARERLDGFQRAIEAAGLGTDAAVFRLGGMGIEDGYKRMDEVLSVADANAPDALFAVNLLVHLGLQRRLRTEPESARRRFAIAAFDETPYSAFLPGCRYTVAQDAAAIGAAAARLMLERLRLGPSAPARIVRVPVALIRH